MGVDGAWHFFLTGKIHSICVSNHTVNFLDKLLPKMEILPVVDLMECIKFTEVRV